MSAATRRIVIVGGVAGGASAAARARRVNEQAEIILLERGPHVSFANCGLPYYVGGEIADRGKLLVATPAKFHSWFNIDVRTGQEAVSVDRAARTVAVRDVATGDVAALPYDRLILAPGASPIVPPLAGARSVNVRTLRDLRDTDALRADAVAEGTRRVTIVGAGYIGLELAEAFAGLGAEVTLVERLPQVLATLDADMAAPVAQVLAQHGVALRLGTGLAGFETAGDRVTAVRLDDGAVIDTDLVILAMGVRPEIGLAREAGLAIGAAGGISIDEHCRTSDPHIYAVGDAVEYPHAVLHRPALVPLAGPANRAGRVAGEHAATDAGPVLGPVVGTAIVRVFELAAGGTGLSLRMAEREGLDARAIVLAANHHAGYFPGARELRLRVIYEATTRRLLGGQAVGAAGVDKRLDVLATAIRFGATVDDLASLDLAYAPPFGSAKDPIHLAGFIAENEGRGLDAPYAPEQVTALPPDAQLLDVRNADEWAAGHLPDAVWIPLHELRARAGELDRARPVVTVCRGGQRSYFATRILRQLGFADVRTLSGGMLWQGMLGTRVEVPEAAGATPAR